MWMRFSRESFGDPLAVGAAVPAQTIEVPMIDMDNVVGAIVRSKDRAKLQEDATDLVRVCCSLVCAIVRLKLRLYRMCGECRTR